MKIGVAKEIKSDEYRVALTPAGARELVQRGHEVTVETGAGEGSSFPDAQYEAIGARIAPVDDVWGESELVLKVKEPLAAEFPRLREGLDALHLPPPRREQGADRRRSSRAARRCVAYETVETDERRAAAARADERDRRTPRRAGRRATSSRSRSAGAGLLLGGVPASRRAGCS